MALPLLSHMQGWGCLQEPIRCYLICVFPFMSFSYCFYSKNKLKSCVFTKKNLSQFIRSSSFRVPTTAFCLCEQKLSSLTIFFPGPWASLSSRARVVQELAFLFLFYFFGCVITRPKLQQQSKTQYRNTICSLSQAKHSAAGSSGPTLQMWTLRFHPKEHCILSMTTPPILLCLLLIKSLSAESTFGWGRRTAPMARIGVSICEPLNCK